MHITAVNNQSFTGKIKTTKNGNMYEKTNTAKNFLTGLTLGAWVAGGVMLSKGPGFKKNFLPVMGLLSFDAIPATAIAFLTGSVIDGLRNKHARKSADRVAQLNANA